jgi:DNA-binding NarL/FixJ family response regulator
MPHCTTPIAPCWSANRKTYCEHLLSKDIRGMELAHAIKEVGAGRSLLDNRAVSKLDRPHSQTEE